MPLVPHPVPILSSALLISVQGIVQGVGFRPFVYRLAHQLGLAGTVINNGKGVSVHISGPPSLLDQFVCALREKIPPAARISRLEVQPAEVLPLDASFQILPSQRSDHPSAQIAPDMALCDDCLAEILDPQNRRFRYPFTT